MKENLNANDIKSPDFSSLVFAFTSGITPKSFTSLLELELPGMKTFSNGMRLQGKDLTAMPVESPPPDFDKLLKEGSSGNHSEQEDQVNQDTDNAEVFIYHSHAWEAFLPLLDEPEKKPSEASSTNNKQNIVLAGSMLAKQLENRGVSTLHDKTNVTASLNQKGWGPGDSYKFSRQSVKEVMSANDTVNYFIDIHRDALRKDQTTVTIDGKNYAKLFFIVGVGHEEYQKNLAFAKELHTMIKQKYPGLSKGIYKKSKSEGNGIYNQDMSGRSILIEFGGIDNNREELNNTAEVMAEVLSEHQKDALKVNNAN
ncbi:stage II sporulation protein P [Lentibacillus kapialis]|uniref:Stage II sporulation protein P n=1 Tax=Lentibacillus kapialis TaxID=340214 RepID=A0A917PVA1_9BACI|nr:stage II sporulation protein P [Lentibacillus kapialis]